MVVRLRQQFLPLTATLTATRGEQVWTLANNHELSIIMHSATMDIGGRWWTGVPLFRKQLPHLG
jgi:hypothetical protein